MKLSTLFNSEGKHHVIKNAYCEPKPEPIPSIMIGGSRPHLLQVVARHADWWCADRATISDYRKLVETCEWAYTKVHRDPLSLRRTGFGGCICSLEEQAIKQQFPMLQYPDYGFVGTPEQIIAQMQPFISLDVDYFMLETADFPNLTTLELLISEVIPAFH
jgi:alkanesulfonate monooxygenase SsuD/methylene tetrahydromethanopterin reductase-like flavin-dependent oxidoreductase (luciferase family)